MSDLADLALSALSRGDLIAAYDAAVAAIAAGDESGGVRHSQVLALARIGDTERAMERFEAYGLDRSQDPHERAVGARLLKDRALAAPAGERQFALGRAFEAYHAIYLDSGDSFTGINAATLALLAGRETRARELAAALLGDPKVAAAGDYDMAVTKAEALLILGGTKDALQALRARPVRDSHDHGARAGSARRLGRIAGHLGMDAKARKALLAPLAPPKAMHFCGHMFAADAGAEARLREEIDEILANEDVGFAYGALACGGDLLIAEVALDRGVPLHVVLPFDEGDFIAQSVRPGGEGWEARFQACLARAASVVQASEMVFFGDPRQYGYGSRMAMGLARLRAAHLGGEAVQVAIWDGVPSHGPAGTGTDVAAWKEHGGRSRIIAPGAVGRDLERPLPASSGAGERAFAAILFTGFKGFSTLEENALPAFRDGVMRIVAEVLDGHEREVASRNSWGDALYAVLTSAPAAAEAALQLQDRLARCDYATWGLDGSGAIRIGAHYGPAYKTIDPITGRTTFYGTEVSRAARIEPVAPPGAVFVTEPFAAILALEARDRFQCHYVGRIALAKKYGDCPMYRLTRNG